ncbi:MAG: DNA primase [SAR86 cluster bacterium]|uniref:DNA primase n=1 Tax=SAR86 cluster bacterium TaxID=2030880 RepID=A0A2A4X2C9_9GAMM|nr:MAG: DNA primase [SAR86 cluster bacterium]
MAGLIPQTFIDDLLSRADIVEVVDKRVTLKKSGKNYSACCPFHKEKTPSFSVEPDRQFYYCFGCGAGGNAIGFIMNFDQTDFPQAVESLARDNGMEVPREESAAATRRQSENSKLFEVLEEANKFYCQQLRRHEQRKSAVDYLKARGVSGEIARDFCIGYAPPGWDNLLKEIAGDANEQKSLLKAGMVIEKEARKDQGSESTDNTNAVRYYDRFRDRIIFPIRDSRGRTIAFGGRVLGDDKPKYLNSPETPVFHKGAELYGLFEAKKANNKLKRILIVEGYMDVIALSQMGIRNSVATLGTATSDRHLTRLFRLVPEVVFCFDGDDAGRTAAWRALEASLSEMQDGRQVKFLFLPEGEDPDTLVRKIGETEFNLLIEKATPLEQFFFDKLSEGLDIRTIEGRARLSNVAKPLIAKFPNGIYGQLMLDKLSETLGVATESLDKLIDSQSKQTRGGSAPPPPSPSASSAHSSPMPETAPYEPSFDQSSRPWSPRPKSTSSNLNVYRKPAAVKAIELLMQNPEVALAITQDLSPLHSAGDEGRQLLLSLIEMVKRDPDTDTPTLLGYCSGSPFGNQITRLKSENITPIEGLEQEFLQILDKILSDVIKKLESQKLREALSKIADPKRSQSGDEPPTDSELPPAPPL